MEKMNRAFEKVKIMMGMEVKDQEQQAAALEDNNTNFSFMDVFNRNCILSTKRDNPPRPHKVEASYTRLSYSNSFVALGWI
ncbi:hypothetical protein Lalb_Chr03g0033301 [Lupinus albus]|uniref:Uncharacterized protein n=1 Tax=Lupinus albus TaxID=3870 RepID=A0A6A4QSD1_LUPAL|nr:hypothetical protein Lalb_Chr03g0033301 [Lupinus albus]